MVNTAAVIPEEQNFILSSLSPGRAQRRLALAVVLALLVAFFLMAGPLSTIQSARIDAFVPAYATAMFVIDSITAVLLFAQFSILRSRALLAISSGYLFTALVIIPWLLTFPGVFTPGGLLDQIFNPLVTTKSHGMGMMGLSTCRSIIEAHDGRWVAPNKPEGAVFQFMLLANGATSAGASRGERPDDLPPGLRP
jgi:hypothetical protein